MSDQPSENAHDTIHSDTGSGDATADLAQIFADKLKGLMGKPSGLLDTYSLPVKRRIRAVKKLQLEYDDLQKAMMEEIDALRTKFDAVYAPYYAKRATLVRGEYEPADDELVPLNEAKPEEDEQTEGVSSEVTAPQTQRPDGSDRGIPEFWSDALNNHQQVSALINEKDNEVLRYLEDVHVNVARTKNEAGNSLEKTVITFHFSENPFFTNSTLVKTLITGDKEDLKTEVTKIDWREGKSLDSTTVTEEVIVKEAEKKGKKGKKAKGPAKIKTKTVEHKFVSRSFFDFFLPNEDFEAKLDKMEAQAEERMMTLVNVHQASKQAEKAISKGTEKGGKHGKGKGKRADDEDDEDDEDSENYSFNSDYDDELEAMENQIAYEEGMDIKDLSSVMEDTVRIIAEDIYPFAYPWFTGEKTQEYDDEDAFDDDDDDDDDDDLEDDDDEDDDEDDEDETPHFGKKGHHSHGKGCGCGPHGAEKKRPLVPPPASGPKKGKGKASDEDDDEESDDDDDDDSEEITFAKGKKGSVPKGKPGPKGKAVANPQQPPPECKQM